MSEPVDVLALCPHPDDVELFCGGGILLCVDAGCRVAVLDLTDGERSTRGTPEIREREKLQAANLLGLYARVSLKLPDAKIGTDGAHRDALVEAIRAMRPRIVLAPYWEDRHPDHAAAGQLAREACFLAGIARLGQGEPHRPEQLYHYPLHEPVIPSFVVDVTKVWDRRLEAVESYASQFRAGGSGWATSLSGGSFLRFIEARGVWYGAMIGASYGEPYMLNGPLACAEFPGLTGVSRAPNESPPYRMFAP